MKKINKQNTKKLNKSKKEKKKLGMGLSSLLSKDQELASVIKDKISNKVKNSSFSNIKFIFP